jgi:hypothetical protein
MPLTRDHEPKSGPTLYAKSAREFWGFRGFTPEPPPERDTAGRPRPSPWGPCQPAGAAGLTPSLAPGATRFARRPVTSVPRPPGNSGDRDSEDRDRSRVPEGNSWGRIFEIHGWGFCGAAEIRRELILGGRINSRRDVRRGAITRGIISDRPNNCFRDPVRPHGGLLGCDRDRRKIKVGQTRWNQLIAF